VAGELEDVLDLSERSKAVVRSFKILTEWHI
jgi:hypothetical protein